MEIITVPRPKTLPGSFTSRNKGNLFSPRTELGKKLQMLRNRAIDEGMQLCSCDKILAEIETERQSGQA